MKEEIHTFCVKQIKNKLSSIEERLRDISDSLSAETKSCVGDKYETGRAMLHLEKDKIMQQLAAILQTKKSLWAIDTQKKYTKAEQGALVYTTKGNYYLGVSLGKINLQKQTYFAISMLSPIGQLLLGKSLGESIVFRGEKITIKAIS